MTLIRVLGRVAFLAIATVIVSFVLFNHESFGVALPRLELRYWTGADHAVLSPPIPLFVFCACFFVLGVVLMALASMQVYVDVVGSWRRLRKERRAHDPARREIERARSSLAREREDYEPKRRELDYRSVELDHRAEELRRDREALAEARSHLAAERADLAKARAELGAESRDVQRERLDVESARAALERDRARVAGEAHRLNVARDEVPNESRPAALAATNVTDPTEPTWDLAERLDDDVAAVARLSEARGGAADAVEEQAPSTERVGEKGDDPASAR